MKRKPKLYRLNVLLTEQEYRWLYGLLTENEWDENDRPRGGAAESMFGKLLPEMGDKIDEINQYDKREEEVMAQLKPFRCWFKDGSALSVDQTDHRHAAEEARELALLQNAPAPDKTHEDYPRYRDAVRVVRTECLTDGTVQKWKA